MCARPSSRSTPGSSRGLAELAGGSDGALLIAAYVVSLAAFLGALVLLYRLVALELGRSSPRATLLLLAVFPGALFFGAPYSESLFLLAVRGRLLRRPHRALGVAGACAAAASATRSAGLVLLLPLALFWWESRPRRARDGGLAPAGAARAGGLRRPCWGSPRATPCASSRCRTPGRASSRARSSAPGTAWWPRWTARASSSPGSARTCTSEGRRRPVPGGGA